MDPGYRSPLIDMFKRGEVPKDVRLVAAQGALVPRAEEQLALLVLLSDDPDEGIARQAADTLDALPADAIRGFLTRADVPAPMRDFFGNRGIVAEPAGQAPGSSDAAPGGPGGDDEDEEDDDPAVLSSLPVLQRMKLAMKGTRSQRAQLVRDSNKLVAAAVLSSPKLTESEVEAFAKMANVTEDVLRVIAMNRTWTKNYGVIWGLARNPKTPPAISMQFLARLNERDLKALTVDRNVPEAIRMAARKFVVKSRT